MSEQKHQLEHLISGTLRTGVMVAVALGVTGGAVYLWRHGAEPVQFQHFVGESSPYASLRGIAATVTGAGSGADWGLAVAQIGILCLLMTPVTRVALSIVGFALERDWLYAVISSMVLSVLMWSLVLH